MVSDTRLPTAAAGLFNRWILAAMLVLLSILSLGLGGSNLGLSEIFSGEGQSILFLTRSRLPRLASVVLAGMGLSVSGLILQKLSRNPFVSPGTASTVDGARFGYLGALLFSAEASPFVRMSAAFAGALISTSLFLLLAARAGRRGVLYVPLVGLALGALMESTALALAYQFDMVQSVGAWLMGNFATAVAGRYEIIWIAGAAVAAALILARPMMIAALGEEAARSLGLNYRKVLLLGLLVSSLATASTVVVGGEVPFIGLVIPNMVSRIRGDNMIRSLPETVLAGGVFLLAADVFSRWIIRPFEIPVGLTAGVLGSLLFISILLRSRNES